MSLPTILGSGEGESVQIGGSVCTFKATGKDTRGHAGLFEFTMPPGAGASPHIHKELTEMFYVTEGKVELLLADKKVNASQGAFMLVPESTPHGFTNIGNSDRQGPDQRPKDPIGGPGAGWRSTTTSGRLAPSRCGATCRSQSSRPADPQPAACAGASSRSIPDDLRS